MKSNDKLGPTVASIDLEPEEQMFIEAKRTTRKILSELPDEMQTRFQNGAWVAPLRGFQTSC